MRLNLGAGLKFETGSEWVNYDLLPQNEIVKQINLETDALPHEDDSVEYIKALDVLEHIANLKHLLNECHRVLKNYGELYVEVPKFPHEDSVTDPTHVRFFVPDTFKYFSDYKEAVAMYGFKPWKLRTIESTDRRILVSLRPDK
jgi:ubiquinone/menaquinone biosynthesis C-methylase UbiE